MKHHLIVITLLSLTYCMSLLPANEVAASFFNKFYSNSNRLVLTASTVINLDEDISIKGNAEPFVAGSTFGDTDTLTFTSTTGHALRITHGSTLKLTSLTKPTQQIIFAGNASFITQPGITLYLNGATLVFTMPDQWILIPTIPDLVV